MKTKFGVGLLVGLALGVILGVIISLLVLGLAKGEPASTPQMLPSPTHHIIQVTSTPVLTPTPTPAPLLKLGEWIQWNELAISVERYEVTHECRGYGDGPAEGAKLVYVWIAARNVSKNAVESPSLLVELSGVDKHSGWFGGTVCVGMMMNLWGMLVGKITVNSIRKWSVKVGSSLKYLRRCKWKECSQKYRRIYGRRASLRLASGS